MSLSPRSRVQQSVLIEHDAVGMFELVDRVEDYPNFLPWCSESLVHRRDTQITEASITIAMLGIRISFTTENHKTAVADKTPGTMDIHLKRGPFRHLHGQWRFTPLAPQACKIELTLEYEFSSRLIAASLGPVFQKIVTSLISAFVQEAERRARAPHGISHATPSRSDK